MDRIVMQVSRIFSRRFAKQGADAVALWGSRVRGDSYAESDIDIGVVGKGRQYRLEQYQGFLVSTSWATATQHRKDFRDPSKVGGIIPAWRNATIIYDPKGVAKALKQAAQDWQWELLGKSADAWVSEELTGWAEEVHRLIGNLQLGRISAAAVQRSFLAIHMGPILAVHHRILYETENALWSLVSRKMGVKWSQNQSTALGEHGQSLEETCKAALQLFVLTALEIKPLLDKRQSQIITHTIEIANRSIQEMK